MESIKVRFSSIDSVVKFVKIMDRSAVRADIWDQNHRLSATSFLGLMSIDLDKSYNLVIHDGQQKKQEIIAKLDDYLVKQ